MISNASKRSILRWIHIIFSIPILGYIYGPVSEVQQYADAVRFVFLPAAVARSVNGLTFLAKPKSLTLALSPSASRICSQFL